MPTYTKIENSLVALRTCLGSIAWGWTIQNSASCQLTPSSRRYTSTHIRLNPANSTNGSHNRRKNSSKMLSMRQRYYSNLRWGTMRMTAAEKQVARNRFLEFLQTRKSPCTAASTVNGRLRPGELVLVPAIIAEW